MSLASQCRNIRAHEDLNSIGFPHRLINLMVLEEIRRNLRKCLGSAYSDIRTLDVGCGTGYLLKKLLRFGLDAWGLDLYPRGEATVEPLASRIMVGSIRDTTKKAFHIITAVEVLEHVEDYIDLLNGMVELLVPGGLIIITVPNNWEFRPVYFTNGEIEPMYGHLWQFDQLSLEADLKYLCKNIYIHPIYSRTLDRRIFKATRILPAKIIIKLSQALVKHYGDGAWIMGVMQGRNALGEMSNLAEPSARYFKESSLFAGAK